MSKDSFLNPKTMSIILLIEIVSAILETILGKFNYGEFIGDIKILGKSIQNIRKAIYPNTQAMYFKISTTIFFQGSRKRSSFNWGKHGH